MLAAGLAIVALLLVMAGGPVERAGTAPPGVPGVSGTSAARHGGKSRVRKPVVHRMATATISRIDHDWGFVVLDLERGKFAPGNVGYLDRRGENGGLLKVESTLDREAVANIESVESTELAVGDLVLFSPDLVRVSNFNIDFGQVEWFSE